jgi:hypothetical protein
MTDVAPVPPVSAAPSQPASQPANGPAAAADDLLHGPRLEQFEEEIRRLRVKGGNAEPERKLVVLGVVAVVAGFVVAAIGIGMVRGAEDSLSQGDGLAQTILGVAIAVVGVVLWARYSLSRYLRYWLVRQIYEDRAATDRVVDAIERSNRR